MSVYIIEALESGFVKIGYTEDLDPRKRLQSIQTGCPFELKVLLFYPDAGRDFEMYLHKRFRLANVRREWFRKSEEMVIYLAQIITSKISYREEMNRSAEGQRQLLRETFQSDAEYRRYLQAEYLKEMNRKDN